MPNRTNAAQAEPLPARVQYSTTQQSRGAGPAATTPAGELLEAALDYARKGYYVLPVTIRINPEDGKKDPKFHVNWGNGSSRDPEVIRRWYTSWPYSGVAIDTNRSGLAVVDLDGAEGLAAWGALLQEHGGAPTAWVRTRSGGEHHYFRQRPEDQVYNTASSIAPKVDVRGAKREGKGSGGIAFAAPTRIQGHPEQSYEWMTSVPPVAELPLLPEWLPPLGRQRAEQKEQEKAERKAAKRPPRAPRGAPAARTSAPMGTATPAGLAHYLESKAQEVRDLPVDGPATQPVNDISYELAHYVAGRQLGEEQVREALRAGVDSWEDGHRLGYEAIEQGLQHWESLEPRIWEERSNLYRIDGGKRARKRTWDDFGNADRLVDRHLHEMRWLIDTSSWVTYRNGAWTMKGADAKVASMCVETIRAMTDEAELYPEEERRKFQDFAQSSRSSRAVSAAKEVAKADERLHVEMHEFDARPLLLNLKNGILDLERNELIEHAADLFQMNQAAVSFDPEATAPRWGSFLDRVMPDARRRAYLARIVGYTLTASTDEQCLFIHYGQGANGKSVFLDVLQALLGSYGQVVPGSTLISKREGGIPNDVARMKGKRLLVCSETAKGRSLDEELVKKLTGDKSISARFLGQEFFDFRPTGKIHMATNHLPQVGTGHHMERRLRIIGWDVNLAEEEQDRSLADRLIRDELAGVLNWAISGYRDWAANGLETPQDVIEATREHIEGGDGIKLWADECLTFAEGKETQANVLYRCYDAWSKSMGNSYHMSNRSFGDALKERKWPKDRKGRGIFYQNVYISKSIAT